MTETSLHVVTLPLSELGRLLEQAAEKGAERALARVLPPYSQAALPSGVSARALLAACRDGCPHEKRGRTILVDRVAWEAWARTHPMTAPRRLTATAHPRPANDLDLGALLDEATRR